MEPIEEELERLREEIGRSDRKTLDDLLIDGERLIVVDDIVHPKYLLAYDASAPLVPHHQLTYEIPYRGIYEHILMAAIGASMVALLSETSGQAGRGVGITLLDRATLKWEGAFWPGASGRPETYEAGWVWAGIALAQDVLYVAAGDKGVGVLDLGGAGLRAAMLSVRAECDQARADLSAEGRQNITDRHYREQLAAHHDDRIVYRPVEGANTVLAVHALPRSCAAAAVCVTGDNTYDTVVVRA